MTRFHFFLKLKLPFHRKRNTDSSKFITSPVQNPSLPHYSSVTPNPNNYPVDTTSVYNEIESPVNISKNEGKTKVSKNEGKF